MENKLERYEPLLTLNPVSSYILGFIYADGCIIEQPKYGNYQLVFGVAEKTVPILKFIQSYLGGNIRNYQYLNNVNKNKVYVLSYGSKQLIKFLKENYKLTTNKTFSTKFPDFIPDDLIHHFIRGYFDGDG